MEMVNAELDPFLELSRKGVFDKLCMKHIILNLANCLELLVKYRLEQDRNRLMHYTLISTFEKIIEDVADAMKEIAEFVEKEVVEDLPKEAKVIFSG